MPSKFSKNIFRFTLVMILMGVFVLPFLAQAQSPTGGSGQPTGGGSGQPSSGSSMIIKIDNPFKGGNSLTSLIKTIIDSILIPIGGVVAVLMIMWAGFLFVTARGNTAQITKAKDALLWAVIGAAILLGAWAISQSIETTINQLRG
jgi:type IV secretory pathway VirB2 component (pilin)